MPDEDLTHTLSELSSILLSQQTVESTLDQVARLAAAAVAECDGCVVTLVEDGHMHGSVATDPALLELAAEQDRAGQGPAVDAWRGGRPEQAEALSTETRWPWFSGPASAAGFESVLAHPLLTPAGDAIGVISLYARQPSAFGESAMATLGGFVTQAGAAVANARIYDRISRLSRQLEEALTSRSVIEQAKGILMERERVGPEEAFDLLRQQSQHRNTKLRDVARDLVEGVTGRSP